MTRKKAGTKSRSKATRVMPASPSAPRSRTGPTALKDYAPAPDDRFTFGLWTVGNTGRDPFGEPTRPRLEPWEIVDLLGEVGGVYGVNFHDNDLIPNDATDTEAISIKKQFRAALRRNALRVAMATTNLFTDPVFRDGAFTSNDADVRAYAVHKTMRAMDLGAEFGAKVYVFWGGREGAEVDAARDPIVAEQRFREALDFLCAYVREKKYPFRIALEAKPNEPRSHLYFPTTGHYLALIPTLQFPDMVGVNPEVAHEHMAGLSMHHVVAQALSARKLFHIDLNDQEFGRYDQDFRFGSVNIKHAFFLVKILTDHRYQGMKHFDSHAYRTADRDDVIAFARGSMHTYKVLEQKVARWHADPVIRELINQIPRGARKWTAAIRSWSTASAARISSASFDPAELAGRPLPYEALDQRTMDILFGL
jgi:xylose isomerase